MTTDTKYQVICVTDQGNDFQVGGLFDSEIAAKNYALNIQDIEAHEYKIISIVTTKSIMDIFTVPKYIPSLEEIVADLASVYAESINWDDERFLALDAEDRAKVQKMVEEETDTCEECGWDFNNSYLSATYHGILCDRCEEVYEDEDESDED